MAHPEPDKPTPAGKDPAEGARSKPQGAPPVNAPEESHLGEGGDPAEGKPQST